MIILSDDAETRDFPYVNTILIFANIAVFAWMFGQGFSGANDIAKTWGTVPGRFTAHPGIDQFQFILTSMFIHGGIFHLVGNMWALYLFGDNVEDRLGHFTYIVFYIACGLFADLLHILSDPFSMVPAVGASGAIAGVMGAYMVLHPRATCKTWWGDDSLLFAFRTFHVPATLVIGGWFALQVLFCYLPGVTSHIAFYAHIGGFLAGMALLLALRPSSNSEDKPEDASAGGALPALALVALIGLASYMVYPYLQKPSQAAQVSVPTAAVTAVNQTQAQKNPEAKKPQAKPSTHHPAVHHKVHKHKHPAHK